MGAGTDLRSCFACGGAGHFRKHCPIYSPQRNTQTAGSVHAIRPPLPRPLPQQRTLGARAPGDAIQGRVFALTQPEEDVSNVVMEGIILLYNSWARILFNPCATHLFIRTTYANDLGLNFEKLEHALNVDLPMGEQLGTSQVSKGCVLCIGEHKLIVDLIALDLKRYDVIFVMDLLSTFRGSDGLFSQANYTPVTMRGSFQFH